MNRPLPAPALALALLLAACSASSKATPDDAAGPDLSRLLGADTTVTILDQVTHKSAEVTKGPYAVTLPPAALYKSITLHVAITCPPGGCDPYDRIASIRLLDGADPMTAKRLEIGRFITPFGIRGAWDIDVTDLLPVLTGARSFESYLETYSNGWVVTATLIYVGGVPSPEPVSVTALPWNRLPIGDPTKKVDDSLPPFVSRPGADATTTRLRVLVSGHGQGNSDNCAEFCDLLHTVVVDGKAVEIRSIWRDDCADNPVKNQPGTWQASREGWCPGDAVKPWVVDLGPRAAPFTVSYGVPGYDDGQMGVSPYENTCSPASCVPSTCAFGNPCAYDGGAHTEPNFFISALLIGYR